jgi:hypothetical protein
MAREEIGELIRTKHTVRIQAAGFVPINGVEASALTTSNYAAILASQPNIRITNTAIKKTQMRYTTEN